MSPQPNFEKIIYLADDDEDDRILFLDAVEELRMPLYVVQTTDGNELLKALRNAEHLPEIIFLDINMPCKNGFECLKEIRSASGDLKNVKIIMLSTSSSSIHIKISYKLGADFYAVKPGSYQGLKELLERVLTDFKSLRKDANKFLLA
ncbi:response regulator [Flavobacterium johnsoniae]|uniref:response regulator n=1 Tax=Flavobacterium johnsoniae TaxID=986 RepID=UPI0025B05D86|nr:response regulator [Flavobacterium johnsoniae]WJS93854.1 response regulator [Flavobacterium johnsoniae]